MRTVHPSTGRRLEPVIPLTLESKRPSEEWKANNKICSERRPYNDNANRKKKKEKKEFKLKKAVLSSISINNTPSFTHFHILPQRVA